MADIRTPMLSLLGYLVFKQIIAGQRIGSINPSSTNNELYLYYDEIMSEPHIPLEVRWFLEQKLITVDGRRDSMDYQSALLTNQINEKQIEYLVKEKKILRIVEAGSGERRLEFSHDTICKALNPIIKMRDGFYNNGNELYFSSFDIEEKQPEMVKYLSFAAELGHLEAKQKLTNLYEEKAKGTLEDKEFKTVTSKRNRLITLLNGNEWAIKYPQPIRSNNNKYDVFISYSRKDIEIAEQISKKLISAGNMVWMDTGGIQTGAQFQEVITDAIKASGVFILIASENSYNSQWVSRELNYAYNLGKRIIPIIIDKAKMPPSFEFILRTINWLDFTNNEYRELALKKLPEWVGVGFDTDENTGVDSMHVTLKDYQIEMIYVEGGLFTMGATLQQGGENPDEMPVHEVRLDSYYIAKVPVTQELWEKVMGEKSNGSFWNKILGNNDDSTKNHPINNVSWYDCITFINCLNAMTGKEFKLPTEAEWEFAAKGGAKGRYNGYKYSGGNNLNNVAWTSENSGGSTHEVGQKQPNELGIYDMSGNVWEWCSDWYAPYPDNPVVNPHGPEDGDMKVCRGGCWDTKGSNCRISRRKANHPELRNSCVGFRLVL